RPSHGTSSKAQRYWRRDSLPCRSLSPSAPEPAPECMARAAAIKLQRSAPAFAVHCPRTRTSASVLSNKAALHSDLYRSCSELDSTGTSVATRDRPVPLPSAISEVIDPAHPDTAAGPSGLSAAPG